MKPIKSFQFTEKSYPEVIRLANKLAAAEERSAHESIKRLILRFAPNRIAEINQSENPSASG